MSCKTDIFQHETTRICIVFAVTYIRMLFDYPKYQRPVRVKGVDHCSSKIKWNCNIILRWWCVVPPLDVHMRYGMFWQLLGSWEGLTIISLAGRQIRCSPEIHLRALMVFRKQATNDIIVKYIFAHCFCLRFECSLTGSWNRMLIL